MKQMNHLLHKVENFNPHLGYIPRHKNGAIHHSSMGCQTDDLASLAAPKERRKRRRNISLEAKREKKAPKTFQ